MENQIPVNNKNVKPNPDTIDLNEPEVQEPPKPQFQAPPKEKKPGKGKKVLAVLFVLLLIAGAGYGGYYYAKQHAQKESDAKIAELQAQLDQALKVAEQNNITNDQLAGALEVKEWGVKIPLPSGIAKVEYKYDSSKALFDGPIISITSITTVEGRTFSTDLADVDKQNADAICTILGLGRSSASSIKNPTTGSTLTPFATIAENNYYEVGVGSATCSQSEAATKATNHVKNMLKQIQQL